MYQRPHCLSAVLIVGVFLGAIPAFGAEPAARTHHDNNGRQLAQVIPLPPASPVSRLKSPAVPTAVSFSSPIPQTQPLKGSTSTPHRIKAQQSSIFGTPVELSPEIKAATEHGAVAAQGLQKLASRRFRDFASWVSTLWRQLNDTPHITPNSTPTLPDPSTGPVRASVPCKPGDLYMTTNGRLRMVTDR